MKLYYGNEYTSNKYANSSACNLTAVVKSYGLLKSVYASHREAECNTEWKEGQGGGARLHNLYRKDKVPLQDNIHFPK